jgi:hypothetical protein
MHVCTTLRGSAAKIASGNPGEPVDAADPGVSDAAVVQLAEGLRPEPRALRFLEPHPENVALAVLPHPPTLTL